MCIDIRNKIFFLTPTNNFHGVKIDKNNTCTRICWISIDVFYNIYVDKYAVCYEDSLIR